ncbi:MAG TPA: S46 family peptidase [Bacteroidales bacterium]|nr:S46 family peptidase [Bacteroidales bacterium]HOK74206.1 S46 family peptidase [Bacteroidales bacterium]HPP92187.1 S46 family peptidase [Bacteroidales bacterium]HRR16112.1 S46 family peptidase [Bacteroidales bacterium]HRT47436.1 S46 family peptidase [Bacteroidales bacterium]
MKKITFLILILAIFISTFLRADEGMWIPLLIEKYNIKIMQEKGFKLTAEDIYSVNRACMKDAIVIFGGGCTGEMISPEGLLITNHHCGYGQIQRHSTLEHDYLTNGFWAMSREEELPNPGLTVTFLKWMEDVTEQVLKGVTESMSPDERDRVINQNISEIRRKAVEGTNYSAVVRPFFMGNQYFLFVNETFRDVRLVGAPPSAIGKFGGETDNWIWPRHTGDFSLFRVYADKNNKPADYSKDNVPYKPAYYFPISLKGVKEGDFTMVFGYPGSTSQYVPSFHIDMVKNYLNPKMIEIRTKKIDIMEAAMASDPLVRIQYSAKKSGIANSWKRWIGENQGLEKMNVIARKQEYEKRFTEWVNKDKSRVERYGNILPRYRELYEKFREYYFVNNYTNEVVNGIDAIGISRNINQLISLYEADAEPERIKEVKERLVSDAESIFRDYDLPTDQKLFVAMMEMYGKNLEERWLAPEYKRIREMCKGDFGSLAGKIYPKSPFTSRERFISFVNGFSKNSIKKAKSDIFYLLANDIADFLSRNVRDELTRINSEIQQLNRIYMAAQMEFEPDRVFYPDANSTLRVTYGQVKGYFSRDAVYFTHYTTLKGIMEKDNPEIYDYNVPEKLRELYRKRDFGRYTQDGEVPVCFIANNHTTGGNSGSPVINAEGHLIGVNFDRAWEGVASDMAFNPEQSRNISLDIRYALFIIDKFAGAGYLLKEMTIIE